jgi:predicted nucleic acid-binding protein
VTVGLDTSVVVRLLVGEPVAQAEAAHRFLTSGDSAAVSDLVVGETYFALRHHYRVPHGKALGALEGLLGDPRVRPTGVARAVLAAMPGAEAAPGLMDRLIHGDYRRDGADVVTFDQHGARLAGARLLR